VFNKSAGSSGIAEFDTKEDTVRGCKMRSDSTAVIAVPTRRNDNDARKAWKLVAFREGSIDAW